MTAWATELEFAYDHGHLYVLDAARHWSEAEVDVRMPRSANFFVPLRVEGWGGRPPLDLDAWDHVAEFSLTVPSGQARARLGRDRRGHGRHRPRRLPRALERAQPERGGGVGAHDENAPDTLSPADLAGLVDGAAGRDQALDRHRLRGELGDLPALLADEELDAIGAIAGMRAHRRRRCGSTSASPAQAARSWDRTIRADGVVRWVASQQPLRPRRAARRAPRPAALRRRPRRRSPSTAAPTDPQRLAHALRAAHAEIAERYIAFEDVVNSLLGARSRCSSSATASSPTAR